MALPPVYKYLDPQGAKLTLINKTFKHAKPADFKDTEDLTIQSIFPEEIDAALHKLTHEFTDVIFQHLNDAPTCSSPMKEQLELIQHIYRTNPMAAHEVKAQKSRDGVGAVYDVKFMRAQAEAFVTEINEFLQGYRVLCVTTHKDSEKMWSDYAENHKGVVLRIEPSLDKDSKFQLFRPIIYQDKRPPFYEDTLEFIAGSLFGDQEARLKTIVEKIVYTKTMTWAHESEYRLAIPLRQNEEAWNTLSYHSEEITELYLGAAMEQSDINEIIAMARAVNPNIKIFSS